MDPDSADNDHVNLLLMDGELDLALEYIDRRWQERLARIIKAEYPGFDWDQFGLFYTETLLAFSDIFTKGGYDPKAAGSRPLALLTKVIRRKACDEHRRVKRQNAPKVLDILSKGFAELSAKNERLADTERRQQILLELRKAIAELPENERRIVEVWRDLYTDKPAKWITLMSEFRFKYPELAVTDGQVQQWFTRARKELLDKLSYLLE